MKGKTSDYIKLEKSKELRKWITYVIVPLTGSAIYVYSQHPEVITNLKNKIVDFKTKISNKIKGSK